MIIFLEVGDKCVPNNEVTDGVCTLITNCDVALRLVFFYLFIHVMLLYLSDHTDNSTYKHFVDCNVFA